MNTLVTQKCVFCEVGGIPLTRDEVAVLLPQVPEWKVDSDSKKITRVFKFKDFIKAMDFVNKVADIAEGEGHHPDLTINYNKVTISLTTHAVKGLSNNDFIVAAKIDALK